MTSRFRAQMHLVGLHGQKLVFEVPGWGEGLLEVSPDEVPDWVREMNLDSRCFAVVNLAAEHVEELRPTDWERPLFGPTDAATELIKSARFLIVAMLDHRKVNQKELAKRVGVTNGYISQLLTGKRNMTLRTLATLADALDYDIFFDPHAKPREEQHYVHDV